MRDYAKGIEAALISYEKVITEGACEALQKVVAYCSDEEIREIARSGKLGLFMQKTLFDIIRTRQVEKSGFRKFLDMVLGKA